MRWEARFAKTRVGNINVLKGGAGEGGVGGEGRVLGQPQARRLLASALLLAFPFQLAELPTCCNNSATGCKLRWILKGSPQCPHKNEALKDAFGGQLQNREKPRLALTWQFADIVTLTLGMHVTHVHNVQGSVGNAPLLVLFSFSKSC